SPRLSQAIQAIESGWFSSGDAGLFTSLANALRHHDYYMVTADFDTYYATQRQVDELWPSQAGWTRMSILNMANMAWFSSDRSISEYAHDIWNVPAAGAQ
ncbi:glycogen/starch/alpha-glucan phosphorylase, partial [Bradyrhizobium sp.]|uniref:glycogen/starch/alpha-glucan phosphorylase n=1 Tax=Bradyrhizobium sp. TaxID=376 RepID=UPI001EC110F6